MANEQKRYEATGPVLVGLINQNIVDNFRQGSAAELHLPPLRALAKMLDGGQDYVDAFAFATDPESGA